MSRISAAPEIMWNDIGPTEHFVQFYENDSALFDTIDGFIGTGLCSGDAAIVIAKPAHLLAVENRLRSRGLDVAALIENDQYIPLDAAATLAKFLVKGWPDRTLFTGTIRSVIQRASKNNRPVRAFGEMVSLLWEQGNRAATIRLENLWNDLRKTESFSLFCAYPKHGFDGEGCCGVEDICREHSRVISAAC